MLTFKFFGGIFSFLFQWWFWLPIVILLLYLSYQNFRKAKSIGNSESIMLLLEIPKNNEKNELSAEQMFASLHGILRSKKELTIDGAMQDQISFEIVSTDQQIKFYVWCPIHLKNFVEGQIYAQYPTVQIKELDEDYSRKDIKQSVIHSTEIILTDNEALPIKTFPNFEVDPLAGITATLTKLDQDDEELWMQIITRPIDDSWHKKSLKYIDKVKKGSSFGVGGGLLSYLAQIIEALWKPPEDSGSQSTVELSERTKSRVDASQEKSNKLGYKVKIRIIYLGNDKAIAKHRIQAMVGTFKQFNSTNLNGFKPSNQSFNEEKLAEFRARHFIDGGFVLNIEELASIYHLPHESVATPHIVWAASKTSEPPTNIPTLKTSAPTELSLIGSTNFRGSNQQFGLKRRDRGRHTYIIGQTGTGKSFLLQLLTLADIYYDQGFAIVDPHGDYAVNMLRYIPEHRINDVIYFNPADTEFPIAFNPLEVIDPNLKNHISSELVGVLKRMFENSWGPRLEYILRYTILALLDYPNATMLDMTKMLTDKKFRDDVISHIKDPVVDNFWRIEFASWNEKFMTEAVAPILNKVGAFIANPIIRNIVGQPKSAFNVREIMDEGKIIVFNLSRGMIGEDNAAILGAMIVTKIQLAAMSRADIPNIDDRRPFYLYVDEFQNFATDSFAVILSEARKYGLNLTVANQYISQMTEEVRDAVFGNVGSIISFRVGAEDSAGLVKYFEPQFEAQDLIQLNNMHWVAALAVEGEKAVPFSAKTLYMPEAQNDLSSHIVARSRNLYSAPRTEIEQKIQAANINTNMTSTNPRASAGKSNKNSKQSSSKKPDTAPNTQKAQNQNQGVINENFSVKL